MITRILIVICVVLAVAGCGKSAEQQAVEKANLDKVSADAAAAAQAELDADSVRFRKAATEAVPPPSKTEKSIVAVQTCWREKSCSPYEVCRLLRRMETQDVVTALGQPDREQGVGGSTYRYYKYTYRDSGVVHSSQIQIVGGGATGSCNYY